jgi:hypothetical protein
MSLELMPSTCSASRMARYIPVITRLEGYTPLGMGLGIEKHLRVAYVLVMRLR